MKNRYEILLTLEEKIYDLYQELSELEFCKDRLCDEYFNKYEDLKLLREFEDDILNKFKDHIECQFLAEKIKRQVDYIYEPANIKVVFDNLLDNKNKKEVNETYKKQFFVYNRIINRLFEKAYSFYDFRLLSFEGIESDEFNYNNVSYDDADITYIKGNIASLARIYNRVKFEGLKVDYPEGISIMGRIGRVEEIFALLETEYYCNVIYCIDNIDKLYKPKPLVDFKYYLLYLSGKLENKYFFYVYEKDKVLCNQNDVLLYYEYRGALCKDILIDYFKLYIENIEDDCRNIKYEDLSFIEACDSVIGTAMNMAGKQVLGDVLDYFKKNKEDINGCEKKPKIYSKVIKQLEAYCQ